MIYDILKNTLAHGTLGCR